LNVLNYLDGAGAPHSGVPMFEYVNHQQNRTRPSDGQVDLGAYEYSQTIINNLRLSGGNAFVSFNAQSGNQYDLQYASNAVGGAWLPVTTNVPGSNGVMEVTDTNGAGFPRRFYRIRPAL
jgi:hypothetical protein